MTFLLVFVGVLSSFKINSNICEKYMFFFWQFGSWWELLTIMSVYRNICLMYSLFTIWTRHAWFFRDSFSCVVSFKSSKLFKLLSHFWYSIENYFDLVDNLFHMLLCSFFCRYVFFPAPLKKESPRCFIYKLICNNSEITFLFCFNFYVWCFIVWVCLYLLPVCLLFVSSLIFYWYFLIFLKYVGWYRYFEYVWLLSIYVWYIRDLNFSLDTLMCLIFLQTHPTFFCFFKYFETMHYIAFDPLLFWVFVSLFGDIFDGMDTIGILCLPFHCLIYSW